MVDAPIDCEPAYGLDIGINSGLTACVRVSQWRDEDEKHILYIEREVTEKGGVAYQDMGDWLAQIVTPGALIRSDHQIQMGLVRARHGGFEIQHALKGPNSISEGVWWIKGCKRVIVHPSCKETIREFRTYSYEVHPRTGVVNHSKYEDANDHCIDAIRYAVEPHALGRDEREPYARSRIRN